MEERGSSKRKKRQRKKGIIISPIRSSKLASLYNCVNKDRKLLQLRFEIPQKGLSIAPVHDGIILAGGLKSQYPKSCSAQVRKLFANRDPSLLTPLTKPKSSFALLQSTPYNILLTVGGNDGFFSLRQITKMNNKSQKWKHTGDLQLSLSTRAAILIHPSSIIAFSGIRQTSQRFLQIFDLKSSIHQIIQLNEYHIIKEIGTFTCIRLSNSNILFFGERNLNRALEYSLSPNLLPSSIYSQHNEQASYRSEQYSSYIQHQGELFVAQRECLFRYSSIQHHWIGQ